MAIHILPALQNEAPVVDRSVFALKEMFVVDQKLKFKWMSYVLSGNPRTPMPAPSWKYFISFTNYHTTPFLS
jgi:hypothetical protein